LGKLKRETFGGNHAKTLKRKRCEHSKEEKKVKVGPPRGY
jgi:hypothetical protein